MRVFCVICFETGSGVFEPLDLFRFYPVVAVVLLVIGRVAVGVEEVQCKGGVGA